MSERHPLHTAIRAQVRGERITDADRAATPLTASERRDLAAWRAVVSAASPTIQPLGASDEWTAAPAVRV